MLPGHEPEPRRKLAAIREHLGVSYRGYKRGRCDRADAGDRREALAIRTLPMPGLDLSLELMDLAIQLLQMGGQPRDQRPQGVGQAVLGILEDPRDLFGDRRDALRDHEPEL